MIPSQVLICGRTYSVTTQPMAGALGCCDNQGQDITIDSDSHPETQSSVLIHEVFEAMNASLGLRLKHHALDALETAWYEVLVSNPAWWEEQK